MRSSIVNKMHPRTSQYVLRFASKLAKLDLLNGRGKRALDVGCGPGYGLLALKRLGYDVYGFDIDPRHVKKAQELGFENVLQYDAQIGIPFNIRFDLNTCFDVLEHLSEPEKALRNMLAIRPVVVVVDVPNKHTEFMRLAYLIFKRNRLPVSISRGSGFLLKDKDHINVKESVRWYSLISGILEKYSYAKLIKFTNFIMISFGNRNFIMRLPYLGSSTLFIVRT